MHLGTVPFQRGSSIPSSTVVVRVLVLLLAAVAVAGQWTYMDALTWRVLTPGELWGPRATPNLITVVAANGLLSVSSAAVALLIVFRNQVDRPERRGLALAIAAWSYILAYPGTVLLFRPAPGTARLAFEGHFLLVETLGLAGLVRFTTLFPRALDERSLASSAEGSLLASSLRPLRTGLLRAELVWGVAVVFPIVLVGTSIGRGAPVSDAGLSPFMDLLRVAAATTVVLNLRDSWIRSSPTDRHKMWWLVAAVSALVTTVMLVIAGNILLSVTSWPEPARAWRPLLLDLGALGFVLGLAGTQLAPERVDALRLTRRIAGGALLSMTLLLAATVLEVLLASGLFGPVALPDGLGAALAAAGVGSISAPLLRFFDRALFADRVLEKRPSVESPNLATD
ncbi:MAG: hypothetical protein U5R14_03940 [Gemmatimonadota bacterium]|nr:hypothetical protein [Gemmatimonadota bacterium]